MRGRRPGQRGLDREPGLRSARASSTRRRGAPATAPERWLSYCDGAATAKPYCRASASISGSSARGCRDSATRLDSSSGTADDPNVTHQRFAGDPTKSYRSIHPLRIVAELGDRERSDPALVMGMLENLQRLRGQGLRNLIDDRGLFTRIASRCCRPPRRRARR
ncbi:NAD(+)--rifampin ADP-ribosyltransferase [Solimonas soli]|uniref:NAD(+)--rifampin ADP-ribosyltransferase n=1 Tax=Solimonas soli TaxID=413479 RepID=UPI0012FBCFD2|nr:NAD(+)--rifampin ADP-ribosyltransferase [Solimonas soli]